MSFANIPSLSSLIESLAHGEAKPKVLGVHGPAESGKDTLADFLKPMGFAKIAFADPLKLHIKQTKRVAAEYLWARDLKDVVIPGWGCTARDLCQQEGDRLRERYGDDIIVRRAVMDMQARLSEGWSGVIFSDVRYEWEAAVVRQLGGFIVHIAKDDAARNTAINWNHSSEAGVAFAEGDQRIVNNASLDAYRTRVIAVCTPLLEQVA